MVITNVILNPNEKIMREYARHVESFGDAQHVLLVNSCMHTHTHTHNVHVRVIDKPFCYKSVSDLYISIFEVLRDYAEFPCLFIENDIYKIKDFDIGIFKETFMTNLRPSCTLRAHDKQCNVSSDVIWFRDKEMVNALITRVKVYRSLKLHADDNVTDTALYDLYLQYGYRPNDLGCIGECDDADDSKNVLLSLHA